ncbi:arginyltransferase [Tanticharoenia sakaeratensis]|uniref:Aspartate/glutamate leucyltransferase n=1 Tax=Tanticharoenia sakaeratensis NBRC 103193 TaxID=1231623 RepID=A0A0D6MMX8_9PROT|nr:arginyltransferase [Tanticharoenia sakaeratensis]GAN55034.1 arginyl-tRNA-protein transferase [Tanticharoenia sakaeratensis NBRC 103193]GBQ20022.1 arginyl-tRNA-protein transferase [Tanticharoenia sakaeratensis NBRC 103193]
MTVTASHRPQMFYTTSPAPCPYLPGRTERKVITELAGADPVALHDRLSRAGFRRSHGVVYAPVCAGCHACVPIRVPVADLVLDRTQRRVEKRNADLIATIVSPCATDEQFVLFSRYQAARHAGSDMAAMSNSDYRAMIEDTPVDTSLIEFRDPTDRLLCVALIDQLSDGLSAVYTFYDPDLAERSLGTNAVLWQARYTRACRLPYLYLGYWVRQSDKMAYKARFRPAEIMSAGSWRPLDATPLST